MKRTFSESLLIPFSKEDINGFFKTMGEDVQEILEDFEVGLCKAEYHADIIVAFDRLKTRISEYFTSVKIK